MGSDDSTIATLVAAVAGSISGLALLPWEAMTWPKRVATVFVGFTCSTFMAPWASHVLWNDPDDRTVSMMTYGIAAGAHILLPWLIKHITRLLGEKA